MKIKTFLSAILMILLLIQCTPYESNIDIDEFKNPSTEYRPLALWSWMNGYVDTAKVVYELEQMKDKGMRGGIIWDLGAIADPENMIPAGPPFLGPESLNYLSIAFKKGNELGLDIGMAVSSSWNAGGEWIGPEDAIKEVLLTSQVVKGPKKIKIDIMAPQGRRQAIEYYSLISSAAMPYSASKMIDEGVKNAVILDEYTIDDKFIEWDVPEGEWEIFSFFSCNTLQPLVIPSPNSGGLMIDHLSYKATTTHFDSLLSRLPKDLLEERLIKFMEIDSYEVRRMKDWSPKLLSKFKAKYNYDPVPYIPLLLGYDMQDSILADRFRNDYSILVSDMMIEGHFAQSVEIAEKYGIEMVTEAGHGGSPRVDPLKALGNSHIPTGEFWNRKRFWVTKEAASAAHIYNHNLVASESLTGWQHWQHGPSDYKQLIDIALCEGLNQIMFHTFAHNPEVAGKPGFVYHAGEHLNVNTTWWEMAEPFMDYIARCSYMLRQGLFVGDACLYYGDQAPNLVPPKRIDPNITPIFDDTQCLHCGKPKPVNPGSVLGYDYDYMNVEIITTAMRVEDGRLVLPSGQSYRVMLLPDKEAISFEVLQALEKLVSEGATVLGRKPVRTTSLKNYPECDEEVARITENLWGDCDGKEVLSHKYGKGTIYWGLTLEEVLSELNITPDFEVKGIDNCDMHIDYIHRQTETEDIYFISNSLETSEKFSAEFRVGKNMIPQIWDPMSGLIQRKVEFSRTDSGIELEFEMDPISSRFVVFSKQKPGKNDAELWQDLQFGTSNYASSDNTVESIDLTSDWSVSFDPKMGGPKDYNLTSLMSWSEIQDEMINYYSGKAIYKKTFSIDEKSISKGQQAILEFDNIQELASITINGKDCGILWTLPYILNITDQLKPGENELVIEAINTWNNRIVGDVQNPEEKQYTNTNIKHMFRQGKLLESGIIGSAFIRFVE